MGSVSFCRSLFARLACHLDWSIRLQETISGWIFHRTTTSPIFLVLARATCFALHWLVTVLLLWLLLLWVLGSQCISRWQQIFWAWLSIRNLVRRLYAKLLLIYHLLLIEVLSLLIERRACFLLWGNIFIGHHHTGVQQVLLLGRYRVGY